MKTTALLAEALLHAVLQEGGQLQVFLADAVALVILLLTCKIFIAAVNLRIRCQLWYFHTPANLLPLLSSEHATSPAYFETRRPSTALCRLRKCQCTC